MSRTCPFCEEDNTEVHNDPATPDDIYHWYCNNCEEVIS